MGQPLGAHTYCDGYQALVGNFDGEGPDDIFWYSPGNDFDCPDTFEFHTSTGTLFHPRPVNGSYIPLVGDFDNNGYDDIFWYGPGGTHDTIWFIKNYGGWYIESEATAVNGTYTPVVGNFNSNGGDDIFWYAAGSAPDYIWTWYVGVRFSYSRPVNGTYRPIAGDFDGNGVDDILWYGVGGYRDYLWFGEHDIALEPLFTAEPGFQSGDSQVDFWSSGHIVGDFGGDGADDILFISDSGTDQLRAGHLLRAVALEDWNSVAVSLPSSATHTFSGNFDADGKMEVAYFSPSHHQAWESECISECTPCDDETCIEGYGCIPTGASAHEAREQFHRAMCIIQEQQRKNNCNLGRMAATSYSPGRYAQSSGACDEPIDEDCAEGLRTCAELEVECAETCEYLRGPNMNRVPGEDGSGPGEDRRADGLDALSCSAVCNKQLSSCKLGDDYQGSACAAIAASAAALGAALRAEGTGAAMDGVLAIVAACESEEPPSSCVEARTACETGCEELKDLAE